ncbi:MAG: type I-E CRISPR-associated protein Cas5/CasD [Thiolinea sp.]
MQDYLVFQLYAPLVSWGDQAVGQERPSADHPSRSALIGLLGAALGIDRNDDVKQAQLVETCRFGIKAYSPGLTLRDFHTSQVPPSSNKVHHLYTRKNELAEPKLGTILSYRSYQQDSFSVVALWLEKHSGSDALSLAAVADALKHPHYPLYLGRKSCPLALPLKPTVIEAESLQAALDQYEYAGEMRLLFNKQSQPRYYWEHSEQIGMTGAEAYRTPRYDQPLNRRRWQFTSRDEYVRYAGGEE